MSTSDDSILKYAKRMISQSRDNKVHPRVFEALFIRQLQNRLRLSMGKNYRQPLDKPTPESTRLPDIICGTVLSILKQERKKPDFMPDKLFTYEDIGYFFEMHHEALIELFPNSKSYAIPSKSSISAYCRWVDLQTFVDGFTAWTRDISECIPLVKPCTQEIINFGLRDPKAVIWITHNWTRDNLEIIEIVRQYFPVSPPVIDKSPVTDLF